MSDFQGLMMETEGLMMESEGKYRNFIMKQCILAVFSLVEIVLRCTLTMNDFQGLMMQLEGGSAAVWRDEVECVVVHNLRYIPVYPQNDNKIICRVEKPKMNSTLLMEYEDANTKQRFSRILARLEVEMNINFTSSKDTRHLRCCYGYGENFDYCREVRLEVMQKVNRHPKKRCIILELQTVAVIDVFPFPKQKGDCNISVTPTEVALGDPVHAICQSREGNSRLNWHVNALLEGDKEVLDFKSSIHLSNTSTTAKLDFKLSHVVLLTRINILCMAMANSCGLFSLSVRKKRAEYTRISDKWITKTIGMTSGVAVAFFILLSLAMYRGAKRIYKRRRIQKSSVKVDVGVTKESDYDGHHYECIDDYDTPLRKKEEEMTEPKYEEIPYVRNALQPVVNNKVDEYVTVHPDPNVKQVVVHKNVQASLKNITKPQQGHEQSHTNCLKEEMNKESRRNNVRNEYDNVISRIPCKNEFKDQNISNKEFSGNECKSIELRERGNIKEERKCSDKAIVPKDCGNDIYLDMTPKR
ncbi:hypothetical protein EVAR_67260_1 [Eumeta japonica]|uniref:Uncharacterized protein n=1 Tax=Eumeta variegata TaxID=151549 RepID=A0A4C1ZQ91_EUMVA|nr:hypothetical protein EVAR_67260_1 [Eumeta japonica]